MPKLIISGSPTLDGEYEFELVFTHRDHHTIKQVAGVRANEFVPALEAGDMDVVVALAKIVLERARVPHTMDMLWDLPLGTGITVDLQEQEEEEESPPPPSTSEPSPSEPASSESERTSSGESTNGAMAGFPETSTPDASGIPLPASSSDPETSTT